MELTGTYTAAARAWLVNDGMWREIVIGMSAKAVWEEIGQRYELGRAGFILDHDRMTYRQMLTAMSY